MLEIPLESGDGSLYFKKQNDEIISFFIRPTFTNFNGRMVLDELESINLRTLKYEKILYKDSTPISILSYPEIKRPSKVSKNKIYDKTAINGSEPSFWSCLLRLLWYRKNGPEGSGCYGFGGGGGSEQTPTTRPVDAGSGNSFPSGRAMETFFSNYLNIINGQNFWGNNNPENNPSTNPNNPSGGYSWTSYFNNPNNPLRSPDGYL